MRPLVCVIRAPLTLLAALILSALVFLAHGVVSVVYQFVVFRAVVARADLLAALGLLALTILTFFLVGIVDQFVTPGTVVGVAVHRVWCSNSRG